MLSSANLEALLGFTHRQHIPQNFSCPKLASILLNRICEAAIAADNGLLDSTSRRATLARLLVAAETEMPAEENRQGEEEQCNRALQEHTVVVAVHQDGLT